MAGEVLDGPLGQGRYESPNGEHVPVVVDTGEPEVDEPADRPPCWSVAAGRGAQAEAPDSGLWLPVEPLARSLGLGAPTCRNAPARRAISRLVDFRLAHVDCERDVLAVRTLIPALSERAAEHLPGHLRLQHATDHPPGGHAQLEDAGRQCWPA